MTQETDARDARAERLIAKIKSTRGFMHPEWEHSALANPDMMEAYEALSSQIFRPDDSEARPALPLKYRELFVCAIQAMRGEKELLTVHVRRALQMGATPDEVREMFETILLPAGAIAWVNGVRSLLRVLAEKPKEGAGGS